MDENQDGAGPGLQPYESPEDKLRREAEEKEEAERRQAEQKRREIERELAVERRVSQRRHEPAPDDDDQSPDGEEHRHKSDDRRVRNYGVRLKTAETQERLEAWLEENCEAQWTILVDDISDDRVKRTMRVMFEMKADRDLFHATFIAP